MPWLSGEGRRKWGKKIPNAAVTWCGSVFIRFQSPNTKKKEKTMDSSGLLNKATRRSGINYAVTAKDFRLVFLSGLFPLNSQIKEKVSFLHFRLRWKFKHKHKHKQIKENIDREFRIFGAFYLL